MKNWLVSLACFGIGVILGSIICKNYILNANQDWYAEEAEPVTAVDKALISYNNFLNDKKSVDGIDIDTITIPKGEKDRRYATKYAFWDSNGDNIPELHINSARYYYVLSYIDDELTLFKDFSPCPQYYALSNGGFISHKFGAAPNFDVYNYSIYNFSGDEIFNINFSKYDLNENGIYDNNDEYFFDGVNVTKEMWEKLTERYIYRDAMEVEQIRNEINWTILYEGDLW